MIMKAKCDDSDNDNDSDNDSDNEQDIPEILVILGLTLIKKQGDGVLVKMQL